MGGQTNGEAQQRGHAGIGKRATVEDGQLVLHGQRDETVDHRQQHLLALPGVRIVHREQPGAAETDVEGEDFGTPVLPVDRRGATFFEQQHHALTKQAH